MMSRELELENANLKEEYHHLKTAGQMSPPDQIGSNATEAEILAEAALLRQHRNRLEGRMVILEEHNRQLENQLSKLKTILEVSTEYWSNPN